MTVARAQSRMWQTIRCLRRFTIGDIVATAEVSHDYARKYVRVLALSGRIKPGDGRWILDHDTGPRAPRLAPGCVGRQREPTVTLKKSDYARALTCVRACQGMLEPEREIAALRRGAR